MERDVVKRDNNRQTSRYVLAIISAPRLQANREDKTT